MKQSTEFHDYVVHDLFAGISGIRSKAMFGGWGIYKDEHFFAIIAEGELYFKVDDVNKGEYQRYGSHPFIYQVHGKKMEMSYWLLPEEVMENPTELVVWVEAAVAVQIRSKHSKEKSKKTSVTKRQSKDKR